MHAGSLASSTADITIFFLVVVVVDAVLYGTVKLISELLFDLTSITQMFSCLHKSDMLVYHLITATKHEINVP